MSTKVVELPDRPQQPRSQCKICNPRRDEVPADHLWAWSLANPGEKPFRAQA